LQIVAQHVTVLSSLSSWIDFIEEAESLFLGFGLLFFWRVSLRKETLYIAQLVRRRYDRSGSAVKGLHVLNRPVEKAIKAVRLAGGRREKITYQSVARHFLGQFDRKSKKTRAERLLHEIYDIVIDKEQPASARVQAAEWLRRVAYGDIPKPPQVVQVIDVLREKLPEDDFAKLVKYLKGGDIEDAEIRESTDD